MRLFVLGCLAEKVMGLVVENGTKLSNWFFFKQTNQNVQQISCRIHLEKVILLRRTNKCSKILYLFKCVVKVWYRYFAREESGLLQVIGVAPVIPQNVPSALTGPRAVIPYAAENGRR